MTHDEIEQLRWVFAGLQGRATKEGAKILYRAFLHICDQEDVRVCMCGSPLGPYHRCG